MSKHTPGPWAVHPRFAYVVPEEHLTRPLGAHEDDAIDLEKYAQEIAAIHMPDRHRSESETRANAKLIAAAPDLLFALQRLIANGEVRDAAHKGEITQAQAAIAKAAQP